MEEICTLGVLELAARIRRGELSAREVVGAHLERIREVNPQVNAVVEVLAEGALAAAAAADAVPAAERGPLHGVPLTVKQNIDVHGRATTWGVRALQDAVATEDAPFLAHLRAAGAIPIGRTNLSDFAFRWHTESQIAGHTRNPWHHGRTPGGSSGGDAAALAAGMTPLGVGNDLGGSLRVPAQACGITSLRPTLGRIADASVVAPFTTQPVSIQLLNCQGPMARHARDLRAAFEVMIQPSPRDAAHAPVPALGAALAAPVRVALVRDPLGLGVHPQVAEGVERAAEHLHAAGYAVEEASPPMIAEAAAAWSTIISADAAHTLPLMLPLAGEGLQRFLQGGIEAGALTAEPDPAAVFAAFQARQAIGRAWAQFSERYPIIVGPIATIPPWTIGWDLEHVGEAVAAMAFVLPINLLGLPTVAVPVGLGDGLPQVVQLIGRRWREDVLLDAAEAIEALAPPITPIDPR